MEDWDADAMLSFIVAQKQFQTDITTALLDPRPQPRPRVLLHRILDRFISNLAFMLLNIHFRITDYKANTSSGFVCDRLSCEPDLPSSQTLWSTPRKVEAVEVKFFLDPGTEFLQEPYYNLEVGMVALQIQLPDIFQVIRAYGPEPNGKGKRLRISGRAFDAHATIREKQMIHFLYSTLEVFYGGEFRAWRTRMIQDHVASCRELDDHEKEQYKKIVLAYYSTKWGSNIR